ncbi:MAG: YetF domain-containing protein [Verrucomicrobiales bacterium]
MSPDVFFAGWGGVVRTLAVGVPAYVALVLILRLSGKRSLAQMNAFDLVVTVSLGSTLATTLLSKSVALVEGITALALLVFLQFLITWLSVRSTRFRKLIRSEPSLLYHRNAFVDEAMKKQRVSRDEVLQVVRSQGMTGMSEAGSVIMETDGTFSVLPESRGEPEQLLSNVSRTESDPDGKA